LFKITETYRAGAEGREKIETLLRCIYSVLQDLLFLESQSPALVRNTDVMDELRKLSQSADFAWLSAAAERLGDVERGLRRNLLRSLSLDAFEAALEKTGAGVR
jgi:DNA polymerase-3 subunit delta'